MCETVAMSFFGKQFKKVRAENALEVIGKLNLSEQIVALIRNPDSSASYSMNLDGTIQYVVKDGSGTVILDQKIALGDHIDFTTGGMETKVKFVLEGDLLKSHIHLPDGKVVHMDRYFEADGMKMEIYIKDASEKATIYYEVV